MTANEFLELVRKSGVLDEAKYGERVPDDSELPADARECAARLVRLELLTPFQASQILGGKTRGFRLGPYRILRPLGQGGMGVVYLGEHLELNRKVALKILQPDKGMDKLALERFLREARAVAALDHPNIVRIHDVGQHGQVRFLAMEFVDGETLESLLHKGGAMSLSRAVDYITQAAVGLQHAHEKGFVHRDIKPGNLMLTRDGTVKILDMGLARSTANPKDKLTEVLDEGAVVGTVDFIAPEQAMNMPEIDIRADIYSLGATFFSLVTGKPPFQGTTQQKLIQHQMKAAPSLAKLDKTFPPELAAVLARMLEKRPDDRYQTPADVVTALAAWLPAAGTARVVAGLSVTDMAQTEKMQAALTGLVSSTTKRLRKKKKKAEPKWKWWAIGGGSAAALVLAIVIAVAATGGGGKEKDRGPVGAVPPGQPADPPPAQPVVSGVLPVGADGKPLNLDFETGTLKDWTAEGDAFRDQPIEGDTVAPRRFNMRSRHQGRFWIGGYEKFFDPPTGTLTSVPFKVTRPWASFLVGGGAQEDLAVEIVLRETGTVLYHSRNGVDSEDMTRVWVDLTKFKDKEIFVRIVDNHTGHWGHINFDDFRFHDRKP